MWYSHREPSPRAAPLPQLNLRQAAGELVEILSLVPISSIPISRVRTVLQVVAAMSRWHKVPTTCASPCNSPVLGLVVACIFQGYRLFLPRLDLNLQCLPLTLYVEAYVR